MPCESPVRRASGRFMRRITYEWLDCTALQRASILEHKQQDVCRSAFTLSAFALFAISPTTPPLLPD